MSGSILVVNYRTHRINKEDAYTISIMRPNLFGNPFRISANCTREEAIEKYRRWLRLEYAKKTAIYQQLLHLAYRYANGQTITLVCCCAPKPCHGNVIADAIRALAARYY